MSDQKSALSTENELHDIQDLHERDIIPEIKQVELSSVVTESDISKLPPAQQAAAIVKEFNKLVKEDERAITTTFNPCRGDRIDRGQFLLAHRNFVPEIHPYSQNKLAIAWAWYLPNTIIEKISVVPQTDSFGAHGTYCINVPLGKYCKVWYGNIPKLLGPGYHVVHDTTFRYDTFHVDISSQLIQHGTIHILRIPVGKIAKCWWGPTPNLLYARGDGSPYVINDALFKLDSFVDQNDNYIGHGTIHILRVDAGKFAKIWIGNQAQLLPSRKDAYVFHSPYFKFNPSDVCSQMDRVINHGVITVLRIPAGYAMKCWIGTEPKILDSRPDPYRWEDPLFRMDSTQLFNQLNPYIKHGNIHRLRIPAGKLAKVWEGTTAKILESRIDTYEFVSPYFRVQPVKPGAVSDDEKRGIDISSNADDLFEDAFNPYIAHGPIHLIRVPSGKVARVWDGSKAMLLEYSPDIYRFESPYFRLERTASGDLFEDATNQCIIHGALKRIMPRTGEIGISYENGKLIIRDPPKDTSKPLLIDSATCSFDGFLSVGVQTLVFPSEEMKVQRRAEKMSEDEVNYEVFTTRDSLRIGVKLLVAFRIVNPVLALTLLGKDGILRHVENCLAADTPISLSSGTSQPIADMSSNQRGILTYDAQEDGAVSGQQTKWLDQGVKECIELVLEDGRCINCTPDHQFLVYTPSKEKVWKKAADIDSANDLVVVSVDYPAMNLKAQSSWTLTIPNGGPTYDLESACIFSRILGYLITDGSIGHDDRGYIALGHQLDVDQMLVDLKRLFPSATFSSNLTSKREDETRGEVYKVNIPTAVMAIFKKLDNVTAGQRIGQDTLLPQYVLMDATPLVVKQEFLAGLFGGDGWTFSIDMGGRIQAVGIAASKIAAKQANLLALLKQIKALLIQCGFSSDCIKLRNPTEHGSTRNNGEDEDHKFSQPLAIAAEEQLLFHSRIGFRYCHNKSMRSSICASFRRMQQNVDAMNQFILQRVSERRNVLSVPAAHALAVQEAKSRKYFNDKRVIQASACSTFLSPSYLKQYGGDKSRMIKNHQTKLNLFRWLHDADALQYFFNADKQELIKMKLNKPIKKKHAESATQEEEEGDAVVDDDEEGESDAYPSEANGDEKVDDEESAEKMSEDERHVNNKVEDEDEEASAMDQHEFESWESNEEVEYSHTSSTSARSSLSSSSSWSSPSSSHSSSSSINIGSDSPASNKRTARGKCQYGVARSRNSLPVFYLKLSRRTSAGKLRVYDLSVNTDRKNEPSFIANGFIVHNCATVDMGKAIQMCTSKDFLSSTQSSRSRRAQQAAAQAQAAGNGISDLVDDKDPGSSQTILQRFQENVKDALSHDLSEYGIELVRLNFETPKILNKEIAKQLEDQAVQVAKITANESVLEQQYKIAEVQAKQQAEVARIQQERENANKRAVTETENANRIANAEAEKQSAQLRADALLIENETRLKIQRNQGQQFDEHPGLLQLELAKVQAQAWQAAKISMLVSPDEMGKLFSGMNSLPFLQQMMAGQNK